MAVAAAAALTLLGPPAYAATLEVVAAFTDATGDGPAGELLLDGSSIYGTARYGGATNNGTVFRFDLGTGTLTTLASLAGGAGGEGPEAGLYRGGDGALYGTTLHGGQYGHGTVFRLDPGAAAVTTLASFTLAQGVSPGGRLVADGTGNLFGTAFYGGANTMLPFYGGDGTLFQLSGGNLTVASQFGGAAGSQPNDNLVRGADGSLYGTTGIGGINGGGTLFRLAPGGNAVQALVSFGGVSGAYPEGGLVADGAGNLYGTTSVGGAADRGTIFRYDIAFNTLTTLASFDVDTGNGSYGPLLIDAAGNLFGTSSNGGSDNNGTVFRLSAGSSQITVLASLDQATGYYPIAGLIADSSGNLYGTTFNGGDSYDGTLFRVSDAGLVTSIAEVPEPSTWAMMLAGVGAIGVVLRRHRWQTIGILPSCRAHLSGGESSSGTTMANTADGRPKVRYLMLKALGRADQARTG